MHVSLCVLVIQGKLNRLRCIPLEITIPKLNCIGLTSSKISRKLSSFWIWNTEALCQLAAEQSSPSPRRRKTPPAHFRRESRDDRIRIGWRVPERNVRADFHELEREIPALILGEEGSMTCFVHVVSNALHIFEAAGQGLRSSSLTEPSPLQSKRRNQAGDSSHSMPSPMQSKNRHHMD